MKTDEAILEDLAKDGLLSFSDWPELLERLLLRLDQARPPSIIARDFPTPPIPTSVSAKPVTRTPQPSITESEAPVSQGTSPESAPSRPLKENATPTSPKSPLSRPPVPPFSSSSPFPGNDKSLIATASGSLQPALQSQFETMKDTLRSNFSHSPPHTIQRLAELILNPRKHYRTLPSYIRALDRVISVSSSADIFPLPTATLPNVDGSGLLNGTTTIIGGGGSAGGLGSDESLGGALLTPISWLQNAPSLGQGEVRTESTEIVDGPNGAGSIETVSISMNGISSATPQRDSGAIVQGELPTQEEEAGNTRASSSPQDSASGGGAKGGTNTEQEVE
ncbi:MAG: hypothetical protein M1840_002429 [Geoglossum simile]|nr:MAG: hypothetical protein M1840_002429 [Geoglossum simile]